MGRLVKWLIPLLLIGFGLLWPVVFHGGAGSSGPSGPDDPVVFSDYDVDVSVDDAGDMSAVETITAEFPGGRHGIFRYWDGAATCGRTCISREIAGRTLATYSRYILCVQGQAVHRIGRGATR